MTICKHYEEFDWWDNPDLKEQWRADSIHYECHKCYCERKENGSNT